MVVGGCACPISHVHAWCASGSLFSLVNHEYLKKIFQWNEQLRYHGSDCVQSSREG